MTPDHREETQKARWDACLFGVGFVKMAWDVITHVPAEELYINANDTNHPATAV